MKLLGPLHLSEYEITLTPYANVPPLRPFKDWKANAATKSLPWYEAYNKTKHNREVNLSEATVERCLQGVAATIILFCVRYRRLWSAREGRCPMPDWSPAEFAAVAKVLDRRPTSTRAP